MKSIALLGVFLAVVLSACGNADPVVYRVAVKNNPFVTLAATCFTGGVAPTTTDQTTNEDDFADWTLWTGTNLQYLDLGGAAAIKLGDTPDINFVGTAIEGGPTAFTTSDVTTSSSSTTTTSITVTFAATPGNTAAGTIEYKSTVSGGTSCDVSADFVGRKVDTQAVSNYGFNGFPVL